MWIEKSDRTFFCRLFRSFLFALLFFSSSIYFISFYRQLFEKRSIIFVFIFIKYLMISLSFWRFFLSSAIRALAVVSVNVKLNFFPLWSLPTHQIKLNEMLLHTPHITNKWKFNLICCLKFIYLQIVEFHLDNFSYALVGQSTFHKI